MTLLPSDEFGIRGHPGNKYDVPLGCSQPTCDQRSAHVHHCWSRSYLLGQPYEWVRLPDSTVIGNRLGFCAEHHQMLTGEVGGYRARLMWDDGIMWWCEKMSMRALVEQADAVRGGWRENSNADWYWTIMDPTKHQPPVVMPNGDIRVRKDVVEGHSHTSAEEEAACPTCGHVKRSGRAEPKPGKLRPTKEWTLTVPDDSEVGADLLDEWIDDFAIVFGMDEYSSRLKRYHVISLLRGVTLAMRSEIIEMVSEAAGRRVRA